MTKSDSANLITAGRLTSRGAARRDQIIDAATEMFLDQGYEAVSVDEIIRVVGGSKTNLYKQFGDKQGLFGEIVSQMCGTFLGKLEQLDVSSLKTPDGLRVLSSTLLAVLLEDRHIAFQRLMLAVSGRFPHLTRVWFADGPQRSRAMIATFIRLKQETGELGGGDPEVLSTLFHDMIVSNLMYFSLMGERPTRPQIDATIDHAIELFINGQALES